MNHPKPWRVKYSVMCEEWHPKSLPSIVDAKGCQVCVMPQTIGHPGVYDELADLTAIEIVGAVNTMEAINRSINSES